MDLQKKKKALVEFFLEFGAANNLDESHVEKIERVLHVLKPMSMDEVKKVCAEIIRHQLQDLPEDEIIDFLKEGRNV